jgi:outer membrane protein TolC
MNKISIYSERQNMKYYMILILLIIPIMMNAFDLSQDNSIKLSVEDAISRASAGNLTLKNNKIDLNSSLLSLATVWNQFVPNTSLSASIGRKEDLNNSNTSKTNASANNLTAGFNTSLSISAKMAFNIYQAVIDYNSGRITYDQAKKKLEYDIKKSYYNLILLNEQILLYKKQINYRKTIYETNLLKYEKGMISEIDKLTSEYLYRSIITEYDSIADDYNANLLTFKKTLGLKSDSDIELIDKIPEFSKLDYELLSGISPDNNSDVKNLVQNLKSRENLRNIYISSLTPTLNISYSLSSSFNKDLTKDNWFGNSANWDTSSSLNFSISIPVDSYFPFSSVQTNIIKTQNEVAKSKNNIQDKIEENKILAEKDMMKLKQIENSFNSLQLNIDVAQRTYDLVKQSYISGSKNIPDLQNAENNLFDANLKLLDARYQYMTNYLDLKYILNSDKI